MKLAIVTATFPPYRGGTGNVAYHHARLMQERGHEVTVFTADQKSSAPMPEFPFKVEYLPVWFRLGNAPLTPKLWSRLRDFDVVHLHYPYIFGSEIVRLATRRGKIPLVVSYHNRLEEQTTIKRILFGIYNSLFERWICTSADILAPVSLDHLASIHPTWTSLPNVFAIPNGVDLKQFAVRDQLDARRRLGLPPDKKLVLFVGALDQAHRFKNVPLLIQAVAALDRKDVGLVIVGDGELRRELEMEAQEQGIFERTYFVGSKDQSELAWYYNAVDVTVLPSNGQESFGLVLIESMACGTRVIASDLPGVRGVVPTLANMGWRVPPGKLEPLVRALADCLKQERTQDSIKSLRDWTSDRYSWRRVAGYLDDAFGRLGRRC